MDALETLIRETLVERSDKAPPPDGLLAAVEAADRRHPRWPYIVLAAAAVLGIAIAVPLAVGGSSGQPLAERTSRPDVEYNGPNVKMPRSAGATSGIEAPDSSVAPIAPQPGPAPGTGAPATQSISYHGVTMQVPASLPIIQGSCSYPSRYVSADNPDLVFNCPEDTGDNPTVRPGLQISLSPLSDIRYPLVADGKTVTATRVDGHPAVQLLHGNPAQTYFRVTVDIPGVGVRVTTSGPDFAQDKAIMATIRVAADPLGCAQSLTTNYPVQPATATLVPSGATGAVLCDYAYPNSGSDHGLFLVQSVRLPGSTVSRLSRRIDDLPTRDGTPGSTGFSSVSWLRFGYPNGSTHSVYVERNVEPSVVSDGHLVAHDPGQLDLDLGKYE